MRTLTVIGEQDEALAINDAETSAADLETMRVATRRALEIICTCPATTMMEVVLEKIDHAMEDGRPVEEHLNTMIDMLFVSFGNGWNAFAKRLPGMPSVRTNDLIDQWFDSGCVADTFRGHALSPYSTSALEGIGANITPETLHQDSDTTAQVPVADLRDAVLSMFMDGWNAARAAAKSSIRAN